MEITEETQNNISIPLSKKKLPVWNTAGRPTGILGLVGGNSQTGKIEWYDGSAWKNADGSAV